MCFIPIDIFTQVFGLCSSSATKKEKKKLNKPAIRAECSVLRSKLHAFPSDTMSIYTSTATHVINRNSDRHTHATARPYVSNGCKKRTKRNMNWTGRPALESHESRHGCTDIYTALVREGLHQDVSMYSRARSQQKRYCSCEDESTSRYEPDKHRLFTEDVVCVFQTTTALNTLYLSTCWPINMNTY